ncbi:hypothetical protein GLAREA_08432 [Glarea lozoyensis ATCC 20868]|uniref:Uncharacterized protein n=2 Tax=Glarea lozoyensis TaxID=101852 RepID=S3CF18_GLAL2|nr:uncharacterized protein GLAREA_08432 [Glarea lozoyensis ATCC 20868]EHL02168.1 hypothetical protein M7I_1762 [Glarea lozoyensis 74030]EPE24580.1 hypothetical protein GLAREA_08432 [Glarea lozoyensis ATCC 20868]
MGEAISFAFPVDVDYDVNDERHVFDEGLSEDESTDSGLSSNYEELMDFDAANYIVVVREHVKWPSKVDSNDEQLEDEDYEPEEAGENGTMPSSDDGSSFADDDTPESEITPGKCSSPVPTTLHELCKADLHMKEQKECRDRLYSRVTELREGLREIELQIPEAELYLQIAEKNIETKRAANNAVLEVSGLSLELFDAYKEFCESLHPEFGLRDGFSIQCNSKHNNSYV